MRYALGVGRFQVGVEERDGLHLFGPSGGIALKKKISLTC